MKPRLLVLSSLFPSAAQPAAGVFIRERMFRVGKVLPIVVVAPRPWFPFQGWVRHFRPHFRPPAVKHEVMDGVHVYRPRFLCFPGVFKRTDGFFMALGSYFTVRRLIREHAINLLDVHFGYPDGRAGSLLARWFNLPMVLTLRGKEERQARSNVAAPLRRGLLGADRVIAVSEALGNLAVELGVDRSRTAVVGNGIDLGKFRPRPRAEVRAALGIPLDAKVIVSVGTLVERKGMHRVIECLPTLLVKHPRLHYLVVGGAGPEGDMSRYLRQQVATLGLNRHVSFLGPMPPERLSAPLSAADVFVLATSYEGWANVFLEAMACGLPVVTTRVGGNEQVVSSPTLGTIVPFGDQAALTGAIDAALNRDWDRSAIMAYAVANAWERRIPVLVDLLERALDDVRPSVAAPESTTMGGTRTDA